MPITLRTSRNAASPRGQPRTILVAAIALLLTLIGIVPGAHAQQPAEVAVAIDRWGAGNVLRRGDLAALRVVLTDLGTRQRELILRVQSKDADGDRPIYQSVIAGNPGIEQRLWMYMRIPISLRAGDPLIVSVHEAQEDADLPPEVDPVGRGVRPGRLLARVPMAPPRVAEPYDGLLGVVGRAPNPALSLYGMSAASGAFGEEWAPLAHERLTQVMLTPQEMPDRWFGLAPFEAIIWLEGAPTDLVPDAAAALKDWVTRGGHLIIIQPAAGQSWSTRDTTGLAELLPAVRITRREGVSLEPYRALLTDSSTVQLPRSAVLHTFEPLESASPGTAVRVLNGPEGDCIVARRLVGAGAVTLIGIDANAIALRSLGLPQPERFWHRILGLRALRPPASEIDRINNASAGALRQRSSIWVDDDVADLIARQGRATAGVLLGFIVFFCYWIIAGPGGYALLKHYKLQRHAWLAYLASGIAFTGIAWGGATLLRPREVSATHVTIVDHVYGQPVQRARAWMSVLLPTYGRSLVSIGDGDGATPSRAATPRDTLLPWEARSAESGISAMFPDATEYAIEARQPSLASVPARATIKQFQADWSGGPRWGMPRPVAAEGQPAESASLRLMARSGLGSGAGSAGAGSGGAGTGGVGGGPAELISGTLVHDLPAPLDSVVIIVVESQQRIVTAGANSSQVFLPARVSAFRLTSPWPPGTPLDMAAATRFAPGVDAQFDTFLRNLLAGQSTPAGLRKSPEDIWRRFVAQALFPILNPPDLVPIAGASPPELGRRAFTHGLDLGRWFTQPCVIILAQMGADRRDAPSVVPLAVDGRAVAAGGRTIVRWVYPLPDSPPSFPIEAPTPDPVTEPVLSPSSDPRRPDDP